MQFQCEINSELVSLLVLSSSLYVINNISYRRSYFPEMLISLSNLDQIPKISHYNSKLYLICLLTPSIKWLTSFDEALFPDISHLSSVLVRDTILSMVLQSVTSSIDTRINYRFNLVLVMFVHMEEMERRNKIVFDWKKLCIEIEQRCK